MSKCALEKTPGFWTFIPGPVHMVRCRLECPRNSELQEAEVRNFAYTTPETTPYLESTAQKLWLGVFRSLPGLILMPRTAES